MSAAPATWSWASEDLPPADEEDGFIRIPIDLDFVSAITTLVTVRATFPTAGAREVGFQTAGLDCRLQDTVTGDYWFTVGAVVLNDATQDHVFRVARPLGASARLLIRPLVQRWDGHQYTERSGNLHKLTARRVHVSAMIRTM